MTFLRIRVRLDRLEHVASTMPSRRERDRIRRDELTLRKRGQQPTGQEEAELQVLDTLFYDEDQDLERKGELIYKDIMAAVYKRGPLPDDEAQELAELERRYPPDPATEAGRGVVRLEDFSKRVGGRRNP
jgi:hypothetical protein